MRATTAPNRRHPQAVCEPAGEVPSEEGPRVQGLPQHVRPGHHHHGGRLHIPLHPVPQRGPGPGPERDRLHHPPQLHRPVRGGLRPARQPPAGVQRVPFWQRGGHVGPVPAPPPGEGQVQLQHHRWPRVLRFPGGALPPDWSDPDPQPSVPTGAQHVPQLQEAPSRGLRQLLQHRTL